MCLAIPTRLIELRPGALALVELGGIRKEISVALVPEAVVGDYVIVHVGHAIGQIDPEEAERTLALFGALASLDAANDANVANPALAGATRP